MSRLDALLIVIVAGVWRPAAVRRPRPRLSDRSVPSATPSPSVSTLRGSLPRAVSASLSAVAVDVGVAGVALPVAVLVGLIVARDTGQLSGPVIVSARTSTGSAPISDAVPPARFTR